MPHLAPMKWVLMPMLLTIIIYTQMIYFHYMIPSSFPKINSSYKTFSKWHW